MQWRSTAAYVWDLEMHGPLQEWKTLNERAVVEEHNRAWRELNFEFHRTTAQVNSRFRALLMSGRLVAFGRKGDLDQQPVRMPPDIWPALDGLDWERSSAIEKRDGGAIFLAVSVQPLLKSVMGAIEIDGRSLPEVFRWFVMADPEVEVLCQDAVRRAPQSKSIFVDAQCPATGRSRWPVRWADAENRLLLPRYLEALEGTSEVAYVQAEGALADRMGALVGLLRGGSVEARGLPHRSSSDVVPREIWSDPDFCFDSSTGDLYRMDRPRRRFEKRWSALLIHSSPGAAIEPSNAASSGRRRPRRDQVEKLVARNRIDLSDQALSSMAIAQLIGGEMRPPATSLHGLDALAKLIGRMRKGLSRRAQ
jgi:hypothetical protein